MKKKVIIVAADSEDEIYRGIPDQFLLIEGKPLLCYTIQAFIDAFDDIEIILVLPKNHIGKGQEIIDGFFDPFRFRICEGGATRFESVKNGLKKVIEESIVFVHDGIRCLVSTKLIRRCYEEALANGMAIPAIKCKDDLRIMDRNGNNSINRKKLKLIQSPQVFHSHILLQAYQIAYKEHFTDEASVVEEFGLKINLIAGEEQNIKISSPMDIEFASFLLSQKVMEGH